MLDRYEVAASAQLIDPGQILLGEPVMVGEYAILDARPRVEGVALAKQGLRIGPYAKIHPYAILRSNGGFIEVGRYVTIQSFCVLFGTGGIALGDYVAIGPGCKLMAETHRHDRTDIPIKQQGLIWRGIVVEDDVWIGANAVILDGVRLGSGSIVGAGGVVVRDVAPRQVVAGVPARVVRSRR